MKAPAILPLLSVLPWTALGCARSAPQQDGSAVRDSAGIRIVENQRGALTIPWQVDARPLLRIGSVTGDPDHELDRVSGAVRLSGGRIVIANGGSLELLYYGRDGYLLRRVGGRGGGPGEFLELEWLSRYGPDSILAFDVRNHRVSYFDSDGNFGRSVRLEPNAEIPVPRLVGFFADGSLLATHGAFVLGGDPPIRVERPAISLFRYEPDGNSAIPLASFPGPEWVIAPIGPVGQWERRQRPFGRSTVFAAAGDRFYVGDNATHEIRAYSIDGRLIQVIRSVAVPLPIGDADIRAFEDSALATADARARRQLHSLFENLPPPPSTYPAFAPEVRVDDGLNVWVRETSRMGEARSEWSVFSAGGGLLCTVEMPPEINVLDIGDDYVLGLQRDSMDVEYVGLFHLHRDR